MDSGGFILSPPASSVASNSTASPSALPHPRQSPLRPGGSKESTFIRHVDQQILHIQRRFAKRTSPTGDGLSDVDRDKADAWGDVKGYASMRQACKDMEELVGIIWVSGTPGLQVPYLINLALLLSTILTAMPPTPKTLFRLVGKLDHAFASLIQGRDIETGERLPGFDGRKAVSNTEKVRIRSLVERTRVSAIEAFKKGEFDNEELDEVASNQNEDGDDDLVMDGDVIEEDQDDSWDMQLARLYDHTVVELGDSLEQPDIGIITERRG